MATKTTRIYNVYTHSEMYPLRVRATSPKDAIGKSAHLRTTPQTYTFEGACLGGMETGEAIRRERTPLAQREAYRSNDQRGHADVE